VSLMFACKASDVAPGEMRQVTVAERPPVTVYNVDGEFYATEDTCTHGQASLSEGYLDGAVVECPFHAGTFDVRTGQAVTFPCTDPLKTYPVRRDGDDLFLDLG
jgi:nitrite reductase/ring-hydroxylating ferredoxin subunit